jgi:hypothetical protein
MPVYYAQRTQIVRRSVRYGDPADAADPEFLALFARWNAARGEKRMPARGDIDMRGMGRQLPMMQLYDVIHGGADFRFRVAGTNVFRVNGVDMTGKTVSQHPNPGVRDRLLDVLERVAASGEPVHARFESLEDHAVHHPVVESVYLPLGTGGAVENIIGLTHFLER